MLKCFYFLTTLQSPHIDAIQQRLDAHPYLVGTLAAATSNGEVYVWTPEE